MISSVKIGLLFSLALTLSLGYAHIQRQGAELARLGAENAALTARANALEATAREVGRYSERVQTLTQEANHARDEIDRLRAGADAAMLERPFVGGNEHRRRVDDWLRRLRHDGAEPAAAGGTAAAPESPDT